MVAEFALGQQWLWLWCVVSQLAVLVLAMAYRNFWAAVAVATLVWGGPQVALSVLVLSAVEGNSAQWLSRYWWLWLWCVVSQLAVPYGVIEFTVGAVLGAAVWKLYSFTQMVQTGSETVDRESGAMAATKTRRNVPKSSFATARKVKTADERVKEAWGKVFELMIEHGMAGVGARQRLHIEKLKKELELEKQAHISFCQKSAKASEKKREEQSAEAYGVQQMYEEKLAAEKKKHAAELESLREEISVLKSCTALLEKAKKEAEEKAGHLEAKLKQQVQEPGAGKRA